jgi:hypothetical protein
MTRTLTRLPNSHWPAILDRLLDAPSPDDRMHARRTMWEQVRAYVLWAKLSIGRLADDEEIREDIALRVLERLERDQCRHLRRWQEDHRRRPKSSSWWAWIKTITRKVAIDVARTSRENLAARGEPFRFAEIAPIEPDRIDSTVDDVREYLDRVQRAARDHSGTDGGNGGTKKVKKR